MQTEAEERVASKIGAGRRRYYINALNRGQLEGDFTQPNGRQALGILYEMACR
jgi:hypothetical protein